MAGTADSVANQARPAASVLVVRDGEEGLEVLMMRRAPALSFAGGAMVFPGGKIEADDQAESQLMLGFDQLDVIDRASRIGAVREVFEETGILLTAGPLLTPDTRLRLRSDLATGHAGFDQLLRQADHRLHAGMLKPFARWMPPASVRYRYDTRFYVAALPAGELAQADGSEALDAGFFQPARMLSMADCKEAELLFPTWCNLHRLARFTTVAELFADPTPSPYVETFQQDDHMCIADNLGYPVTRYPLAATRRS